MAAEMQLLRASVTTIEADVNHIKVCLARLEERAVNRSTMANAQSARLDKMESKLSRLDLKIAAAMGGVALIAWGFQLLVPVI